MILLDVNVIVYAARSEFPLHEVSLGWLEPVLEGAEPVAVLDHVLAAAVRLLTSHRVLQDALSGDEALEVCSAVRNAPAAISPGPSARTWETFERLVRELNLRGNDVPDAYLAASALDLGARLATFDRGFRRFPGLGVLVPG